MTRQKMLVELRRLRACEPAQDWANFISGTPRQLWNACKQGDWLLWLAAKVEVDRKDVVLAACACARLALPYVRPGDYRPLRAIETAERWALGEAGVTLEDVRVAADAANAAARQAKRNETLARCADLVRERITWKMIEVKLP